MNRKSWAATGAGVLVVGLLVFIGVEGHQSSVSAQRSAAQVGQLQVAASRAAAEQTAADQAAAAKAVAAKTVADNKAAAARAAATRKAAQDKAAADKATAARTAKRTELQAKATVTAYFAAINSGNYRTAYDRGGKNFNSSYSSFRAGFDNTSYDEVDITGADGNRVYVTLTAFNLDCTTQVWTGYYVVDGTTLTRAHLRGGKFQDGYCGD